METDLKTLVTHEGHLCKITKEWYGGYYDLETVNDTELGIREIYLYVHISELIKEGNKI